MIKNNNSFADTVTFINIPFYLHWVLDIFNYCEGRGGCYLFI